MFVAGKPTVFLSQIIDNFITKNQRKFFEEKSTFIWSHIRKPRNQIFSRFIDGKSAFYSKKHWPNAVKKSVDEPH
jgi:hypothetical protein